MIKNNIVTKTKLSKSISLSKITTGLWQIADMERDGKSLNIAKIAESMKEYASSGLTTFDMADHYGSAEIISGIYNQKYSSEENVQMLTKWVPEPGPITKESVDSAVKRSLDRLKMDSLDLLQFHAWNYFDPSWLDGLFYLQELKDIGLIKNIGVTNFDTIHLQIALTSGIDIVSNQISYSLLDQRAKFEMTKLCTKHKVYLLAYGTLAGGYLSDKWLNKSEPKKSMTWSQMKYKRFIETAGGWKKFQELLSSLNEIAIKKQISIANLATKYILQQPQVGSVIIGARLGESKHIENNLNIFNFILDEKTMNDISMSIESLNPIPGDCGDEYRKPPFLTATGDLSHHLKKVSLPFKAQKLVNKQIVLSGTEWENLGGYCRAVRKNNRICISGTTATHRNRVIGRDDIVAQTNFIIDKIIGAIHSLGGKAEDIIRTRIYIKNLDDWESVARIHGIRFGNIYPVNTLIIAELVGDEYLIEIEAEAEL